MGKKKKFTVTVPKSIEELVPDTYYMCINVESGIIAYGCILPNKDTHEFSLPRVMEYSVEEPDGICCWRVLEDITYIVPRELFETAKEKGWPTEVKVSVRTPC